MKAIVCKQYGSPEVLQWQHVEKPVPKDNEILIKIHATTVTSGDCRVRGLNTPKGFKLLMRLALGINRPRQAILGSELAGTVAAIGANVSQFQVGDPVFAFTDTRMGCYAELPGHHGQCVICPQQSRPQGGRPPCAGGSELTGDAGDPVGGDDGQQEAYYRGSIW